jgi:hypothetical protein
MFWTRGSRRSERQQHSATESALDAVRVSIAADQKEGQTVKAITLSIIALAVTALVAAKGPQFVLFR